MVRRLLATIITVIILAIIAIAVIRFAVNVLLPLAVIIIAAYIVYMLVTKKKLY